MKTPTKDQMQYELAMAGGGVIHKAKGGLLKARRSNDPTESMSRRGERTVNEGGTHIMKEENGNWLNDPSMFTRVKRTLHPELNQWVDRNLANYVKKQMGTANDPVRLLAEQGITHLPQETIDNAPEDFLGYSFEKDRAKEGYPEKGLGQSDAAKAWELMSDSSIIPVTAGSLLHKAKKYQDYMDAKEAFDKHASTLNDRLEANLRGRGFEEGDIKAILKGNDSLKASTLNDEEYNRLKNKYDNLAGFHSGHSWDLLNRNLWLKKLDPNEKIYKPNNINQLHFDHIYDVLNEDLNSGRLRPEQLNKVSIEHAIRRTHEYDQEKKKAMAEAQLKATEGMPVHKEYPEGYKWIELASPKTVPKDYALPEGMQLDTIDHPNGLLHTVSDSKGVTQIRATDSPEKALLRFYNRRDGEGYKTLADALKYEGDTMGHCVGGYTPDVVAGKSRIFSLRDAKNEPHVTVEVIPSKTLTPEQRESQMGFFVQRLLGEGMSEEQAITQANKLYPESETLSAIKQIKGKGNAKPKKDYIPYVQDFVKSGNWSHVDDLHNTDLQHSDKMPERKTFEEAGMQVPKYFSENDRDNLIHEYHNRTSSPVDPEFMEKTYGIPKKAEGGTMNPTPSMAEMRLALLRSNPLAIQSYGANEAPGMNPKAYVPPDIQTDMYPPLGGAELPTGGIDTNPTQPGQQFMPQQPQPAPSTLAGAPAAGQAAPQGLQGASSPLQQPPSNILQMTPQGRALGAMTPPKAPMSQMAAGGRQKSVAEMKNELALPVEQNATREPSIGMLKGAFDQAIAHHESLPLQERANNGKQARQKIEGYIGKGTKLLAGNIKLQKAAGDVEGYEPITLPDGRGVVTTGLSLSPAYEEGKFNTCPNSKSCAKQCLGKTANGNYIYGGGADLEAMLGPRLAHYKKTQALLRDPEAFATRLHDEITARKIKAAEENNMLAIRLNVLSDLHPKVYESLIRAHPDVMFYDYTKNNTRPVAPNHHLTYSSTGVSQPKSKTGLDQDIENPHQNWKLVRGHLDNGRNVAMAFSHRDALPDHIHDEESGKTYKVVDGDTHDFRPLDTQEEGNNGVIIGLRKKSMLHANHNAAMNSDGFFTHYDPKFQKLKGKIVRDAEGNPVRTNTVVSIAKQKSGLITLNNDGKKE